jgi:SAM-dependent methyltransferase
MNDPARGFSDLCLCGGREYRLVRRAAYTRAGPEPYPYSLYRCTDCGLVRTHPVPGVSLYEHGYSESTAGGRYVEREKPWCRVLAGRIDRILAGHPDRRGSAVLDVGCNGGELVEELRARGLQAEGCDVDPVAVGHGAEKGLPLFCRDLSEHPLERVYGCVVLNHTLEHIVPVGPLLRHVHQALLPGGLLYIRVPNFRGWIARLMGNDWGFLVPHQHVWQFSPRTLRRAVEAGGRFEAIEIRCRTTMEYPGTGLKGLVKNAIMATAARCDAGDEIEALFRKVEPAR